ncbi:ATP-binding cassette domain-containing protein [Micrococcus sp. HSID17245]|uniref:ATP-dependent nuclease n=1 Tax=Micrococcus sp. HSID17245 TaxID=2419508 RepID=UPI000F87CFBD|nr:AAA family ATPase [Micrococcus sp. HSID17245]RUQ34233.1 ATP-binding cassette domain-containing protein [Micrococcus sp. HSID17245]
MPAPTEPKLTSAWDTLGNQSNGWPQFLSSINISGLRGWTGEQVEFRYPIVALVGSNGSGKSTVLKAAASVYKAPNSGQAVTYTADDFFPKTPWEDPIGVEIKYTIRRGERTDSGSWRKPTKRWRGADERKERPSFFLDVSRIQPANTQIGYGAVAQRSISAGKEDRLSQAEVRLLSRIVGRNYESALLNIHDQKQVGVLEFNGISYSNFHQGAGEDSILDLVYLINHAPRNSLIIIDELEAALHPRAQRGLVTELMEIVEKQRLQIIISTHSPYVLDMLPSRARILLSSDRDGDKSIIYGVTTEFAMGQIGDEEISELDLYCEDEYSELIIDKLIRLADNTIISRVQITPVGAASVVKSVGAVAAQGKLPRPGLGIVDADTSPEKGSICLPGTMPPERQLFSSLTDKHWETVASRLGVHGGQVLDIRDQVQLLDNHHAWVGRFAELIGGTTRPLMVWDAICDVWVKDVVGEASAIEWVEPIIDKLRKAS